MYKSIEGQQKIIEWYNERLKTCDFHTQTIHTPFGDTHLIEAGNPANPPILLLPGTNNSALTWQDYYKRLSEHFYVLGLDIIGQPGKSAPARQPYKTTRYAEWLVSVLDALKIDRAHVVGHSLGGALALKLAAYAPQRVLSLMPIDPAGIISLSITLPLMMKSMPFLLNPNAKTSRALVSLLTVHEPVLDEVEWMRLVGQHVRSSLAPPPLPKAELAKIEASVFILSGEKDVFLPPQKLKQKALASLKKVQVEIVPAAGHMLPQEQPHRVIEKMLAIFQR